MLYTSLNFGIYVTDFDPTSYRLESTMLLFRNKTHVPLILFRVRTAQQSQTRSLSYVSTVLDLPLGCAKLVCFNFSFAMLCGNFERKSNSEDRKAINMEDLELTQGFRSLQNEKPVSGLLSVQSVSPLRSSLCLHHSFATPKWMSFLSDLMPLVEPYCSV